MKKKIRRQRQRFVGGLITMGAAASVRVTPPLDSRVLDDDAGLRRAGALRDIVRWLAALEPEDLGKATTFTSSARGLSATWDQGGSVCIEWGGAGDGGAVGSSYVETEDESGDGREEPVALSRLARAERAAVAAKEYLQDRPTMTMLTPERSKASDIAMNELADKISTQLGMPKRTVPATRVAGLPGMVARGEFTPQMLEAADMLAIALEDQCLAKLTRTQYWGHTRALVEYLNYRSWSAFDWDFDHLGSYCVLHVMAGNKASSLRQNLVGWKHAAKVCEDYALAPEDGERLGRLVKTLCKWTCYGDRDYAFPWLYEFTFEYARMVEERCQAAGTEPTFADVRFLAGCALRGGCGARASGSFSEASALRAKRFRLQKQHVIFSAAGGGRVTVHLTRGKSRERWVTFANDPSNPYCTYQLIKRWYNVSGMRHQAKNVPFFPKIVTSDGCTSIDWEKEETKEHFVAYARRVAKALGLPAEWILKIRGHSWRAGLATDLLSRGVEKWKVMLIGGWLSDCVLLYARVTPQTMALWTASATGGSSKPLVPEFSMREEREMVRQMGEPVTAGGIPLNRASGVADVPDFVTRLAGFKRTVGVEAASENVLDIPAFISR